MSVLVALDESDIAEEVMAAIAPYLHSSGTKAELLTVVGSSETRSIGRTTDPRIPQDGFSGGTLHVGSQRTSTVEDRSQALARAKAEHGTTLHDLAAKYLQGVPFEVHVEVGDEPADVISEVAERVGADAIAIGTHGRGGLRRALLGSVAEAVIRRAMVPVFVVRSGMRAPSTITPDPDATS